MELKIMNAEGTEQGKITMPEQFNTPIRRDIVKRAVEVIEKNKRQPYGSYSQAGKRSSAKLSRRRNDYRGSYGHGISRVPRKILSVRGTRFNWVGAFAPGTVGGRRAHPPKTEKVLFNKINTKENRFAIRSALSAVMQKELVIQRGHKIPESYPFILSDSFESIAQTRDLLKALSNLGLNGEIERTKLTKERSGRGKSRGRRTIIRKGVLFVTSNSSKLAKAAKNIPGFETSSAEHLNAAMLAPGGSVGRATLFTKSAVELLAGKNLYSGISSGSSRGAK